MPLLDTYRNNIVRKKGDLAKLSQDKARETAKASSLYQKISSAKKAMTSTKSPSTIKTKSNEIMRAESDFAQVNKAIADVDKKIAQKEKELASEEKKYRDEEARQIKKETAAYKKRMDSSNRALHSINDTLTRHEVAQKEMRQAIIDLQSIPENITVLFMASNPSGSLPLRLDEEARAIQEMIRKSAHRDSVTFVSRWAVRSSDILQAINEENPDIIHFSGHGTDTDELVLQNSDGTPKLVSKEAIVQAIATVSDKVRLVFFNTCFSAGQAEEIVNHIEASIGMTISIGDDAARVFASQFYSSVGFGYSLEKSFQQAKAALLLEGIPEENTPALYVGDGIDPKDIIYCNPGQIVV